MMHIIRTHRGGMLALAAASAIALLALMSGSWDTAVAQTAGPAATPVTTTTTTPEGTVTVTTAPNGTVTTVVETPRGSVTVVQAPGQPAQVAVAPANPAADTTLTVNIFSATFLVPGGALSAGELITMVETTLQDLSVPDFLTNIDAARIAYAANVGGSGALVIPEVAAEPGKITAIRAFELAVQKANGTTGQIAVPIQMTWDFSAENFAAAGGDFANLLMLGYDEATETWTPAEQVAYTSTSVTFEVPHVSLWAFAVRSPGAPAQAVPSPADTGMGAADSATNTTAYLALAGVVTAMVVTGAGARFALRRTRE